MIHREVTVFVVNAPGAAVVTTSEVKRDVPGTFKVAESHRVYVTKDGQPIGGMVSMEMMAFLEDALIDNQMAAAAAERLAAIRAGSEQLLDADDFYAQAETVLAARPRR